MSPTEQPAGLGLALEHIVHHYGETPVVDDVSLALAPGELVALLGPSGCGKTTLLKIIAGFLRQSAGTVRIGNAAIDDLPPNRRRVGIVFQNSDDQLFNSTVFDDVAFGRQRRDRRDLRRLQLQP